MTEPQVNDGEAVVNEDDLVPAEDVDSAPLRAPRSVEVGVVGWDGRPASRSVMPISIEEYRVAMQWCDGCWHRVAW